MKILTYNVQLFPRQIYPVYRALFDCHENTKIPNRVEKIIMALRATDADIMCLNEIWDLASLEYIQNAFADWHVYQPNGNMKYPLVDRISSSGLLLLSKYPIINATFTRFTKARHAELFVRKGFFRCTVNAPDGSIGVFGTHTQAYNYARTRQSNLRQIISAIADYRRRYPDRHAIALGDFNVRRGSPAGEYTMLQDAMTQMGLMTAPVDAPAGANDCVNRHIGNLDYIFTTVPPIECYANPLTTKAFDSTYSDAGVWLSDHMPVMVTIDFQGVPRTSESGVSIIDAYTQTDRGEGMFAKIIFVIVIILLIILFISLFARLFVAIHERSVQ
jgi:endonuclease/exonuclease/phosphatase family metal-dependent hydrolase